MAVLNGNEYVNNYVIPRLFQQAPKPEQIQSMVQAWNLILSHIEQYMAIATTAYTVIHVPDLPTAAATPMTVAPLAGPMLANTGMILAQTFANTMLIPNGVKDVPLNDMAQNFNDLFAHIVANAVVTVSAIPHSGTIATANGPVPYANNYAGPVNANLL